MFFPFINHVQSHSDGLENKMLLESSTVGLNCLFDSSEQNKQFGFPSSYASKFPADDLEVFICNLEECFSNVYVG